MPFEVTDNETGKVIVFEKKPSQSDINEAFGLSSTPTKAVTDNKGQIQTKTKDLFSKYVRPVLEYGGLLAGGAVATPGTLGLGTVAGAGLGYAAGKKTADIIEELAGSKKPSLLPEQFIQSGKDVIEGAASETGAGIAGKAITAVGGKLLFPLSKETSVKIGKTAREMPSGKTAFLENAKQFGYKPTPAEMADSKTLSVIEGVLGYRPVSGDVVLKNSVSRLESLMKARNELIGKKASPESIELIGNKIKNEAKNIIARATTARGEKLTAITDDFLKQYGAMGKYEGGVKFGEVMAEDLAARAGKAKELYTSVKDMLPQKGKDVISLSDDTFNTAKTLLSEELSKTPATQNKTVIKVLRDFLPKESPLDKIAVDAFGKKFSELNPNLQAAISKSYPDASKGGKTLTWEGLDATRSELLERTRDILKTTGGKATRETRVYSQLTESINKELEKFAQSAGDDVWKVFNEARATTKAMHELYDKDILNIMNKSPEDIIKRVVNNGEVTLLKQIKQATGDKGIEPLRQGFFKQLLDSSTKDGLLDARRLKNSIAKLGDDTLKELATPEQISSLKKIVVSGLSINEKYSGMRTLDFLNAIHGTSTDKVADAIFRNKYTVKLGRRLLSSESMNAIKSHILENKILQVGGTGNYLPIKSAVEFRKNIGKLSQMMKPDELKRIKDFINLGSNAQRLEALAKNPSQTGQVILGNELISLATSPLQLAKYTGVPYLISKAYTSELATKYLINAAKLPENSPKAVSEFIKAIYILNKDE